MSAVCEKCGQPLPQEARRDPPLPPLDHDPLEDIADWQRENGCSNYIRPPEPRQGRAA